MSRDKLKIVFVGHVDHGKSTLIGRLLYDTGNIPEERLKQLQDIAAKQGKEVELAYLLDAFEEEQEQNVTIDTTQIRFKTDKRDYLIIDAPGHKEFLKNMVSGAAAADVAVLLVDAHEGIKEQTRRHAHLLSLLGISNLIVAVNKMDLVGYDQQCYVTLCNDLAEFLEKLNLKAQDYIPISAREGINVVNKGNEMPWYNKKTLIDAIDQIDALTAAEGLLRFPVQDVYKLGDKRVLTGRIELGNIKVGDRILFSPSDKESEVKSIETWPSANKQEASVGECVGITIADPLFIERGEICSNAHNPPLVSDKLSATIVWMGKHPLTEKSSLTVKLATQEVGAKISKIENIISSESLEHSEKDNIAQNDIAEVVIQCEKPVSFDTFKTTSKTGRFVIVDNYNICGGGIVRESSYPDRRNFFSKNIKSSNIFWQKSNLSREDRENLNGHKGAVVWLTGLSGSGKSTIAKALEVQLHRKDVRTFILDGDNLRHGLCADLGFSPEDRVENIRRVGEVAKLFADAGIIVITAFISPFQHDREKVRQLIGDRFMEVHVSCSLETCKDRDPKGLYKKVLAGEIDNFTGISSPYEAPENAEITINTEVLSLQDSVQEVINHLKGRNLIL